MNFSERKQNTLVGVVMLIVGVFAVLSPAIHIHLHPMVDYKIIGMTVIVIMGWELLLEGYRYLLAKKPSDLLNRPSIHSLLLIWLAAPLIEGSPFGGVVTVYSWILPSVYAVAFLAAYTIRFMRRRQKA